MKMVKPGMDGKQMRAMYKGNDSGTKMKRKAAPQYRDQARDNEENRDLRTTQGKSMKKRKVINANGKPWSKSGTGTKKLKRKSKPMIKPSHRGLLHEKLGVPKGEKIPADKLDAALNSKSASIRKEANFAKNFGK